MVQRRIEAKRKQLNIGVTEVQRVYRGHLGRRRARARGDFVWELRLHTAAQKIQKLYRDMLDRQWARYVGKGNLQVLVGEHARRELRAARRARGGAGGTLKPPTKEFYPTRVLEGVSQLEDGVPTRPRGAGKNAIGNMPATMPEGQRIRLRWGLPQGLADLDQGSQDVVGAAHKLQALVDGGRGLDTRGRLHSAAGRAAPPRTPSPGGPNGSNRLQLELGEAAGTAVGAGAGAGAGTGTGKAKGKTRTKTKTKGKGKTRGTTK